MITFNFQHSNYQYIIPQTKSILGVLIILRMCKSAETKKSENHCLSHVICMKSPILPSFHRYMGQMACFLEVKHARHVYV